MKPPESTPLSERELVIVRTLSVSPEAIYRAWMDPQLMQQWFTPRPWTIPALDIDFRPGGHINVTMRGPNGEDSPMRGIFLELIPNQKIVFTDAYVKMWEPSSKPFITAIMTMEKIAEGTRYTSRVYHWTVADREAHEKMGFFTGWGTCIDQLETLLKTK